MLATRLSPAPIRWHSLGARMAIVIAVMSIALTFAVTVLIDIVATPVARDEVGRSLEELAIQMSEKLEAGMFERYREISLLAQNPVMAESVGLPPDRLRQVIERYQKSYSHYAWIGLTDPAGNVIAANDGLLEGVNVATRPWFANVFRNIYVGDVHEAKLLAGKLPPSTQYPNEPKRFVDIAHPVVDEAGRIVAVLGAHLNWEWARDVTRSIIDPVAARRHADVMIFSKDGTVLMAPEGRGPGTSPPRAATSENAGHGFYEAAGEDGRRYLVGYSTANGYREYPGLGWTVRVRQPLVEAYSPIREVHKPVIVLGSVLALALCAIGVLVARQITRPLVLLADSAHAVASGKRDTLEEIVTTYPELNALAEAFQRMVVSVKLTEVTLRTMNQTLEGRVADRTAELRASRERLQLITDSVPALIAFCDRDCRYQFCNKAYLEWLGRPKESIIGRHAMEILPPAVAESLRPNIERVLAGEKVCFEDRQWSGGQESYREVSYIPTRDGTSAISGFYVLAYDVTERKKEQLSLQHGISHDLLTGLPNRKELPGRIDQAKARGRRNHACFAVFFLDIDRFKQINDTWGHAVGDEVLVQFARRLQAAMRETDLVVRLAGDEFVIVAEGVESGRSGCERIAGKILAACAEPMTINGQPLKIGTSIGIAIAEPGCAASSDDLIDRADAGMYAAKQTGRNSYRFAEDGLTVVS